MNRSSKIYVAGDTGLVGSAIVRYLKIKGFNNLVFTPFPEYDLRNQGRVEAFFHKEKPEYVFLAAARVGGIMANSTYPAEFIYDNLAIATNVIHASKMSGVNKLINLGSSCIYPKYAPQPLKEDYLLTGTLEPTNEPYAIAKIAAIKLCRYYNQQYGTNFISVMPSNLYGPGDHFDPETSHVLPAMIRKFHEARENHRANVILWGTGKPRREFLYVDDLADALFFLMTRCNAADTGELINIGIGDDITIRELAQMVRKITGYNGEIVWDETKPDGTPRKLQDVSRMKELGWSPRTGLEEGLRLAYQWFLENAA